MSTSRRTHQFRKVPTEHPKTVSLTGARRGETLSVEAVGIFSQDIEEGAYINLSVKYGLITLIRQTADLCEQLKSVDQECPVKKGETKITKDVEIPKQIPPVSSIHPQINTGLLVLTAGLSGKIHRPGRCLHQGRRADHLPRGNGRLLLVIGDGHMAGALVHRLRCEGGDRCDSSRAWSGRISFQPDTFFVRGLVNWFTLACEPASDT